MKVNLLVRVKCVFRTHVRKFCVQAKFPVKIHIFLFFNIVPLFIELPHCTSRNGIGLRYNHAVTWATGHFISLIRIRKKYESNFKEISKLDLFVVIYECTSGQRKHRA